MREHRLLVATAFLIGGGCGALATTVWPTDDQADPPNEFLYLDNDRAAAYLGQIENGLSDQEERSLSTKRHAEAGVKGGSAISLSGSVEQETFSKVVVTPKAADRFYSLRRTVNSQGWLQHLDATDQFLEDLRKISAGDFVEITHAQLRLPAFAKILPKGNYAEELGCRTHGHQKSCYYGPPVKSRLLAATAPGYRQALIRYFRRAGHDPVLPFRVIVKRPGRRGTVFLQVRYSKLAYQPGLASGGLTIVGKVIRVLRGTRPKPQTYFDVETYTRFNRALRKAQPPVRARLGIDPQGAFAQIRRIVRAASRVKGPGLVVIPIAMFL